MLQESKKNDLLEKYGVYLLFRVPFSACYSLSAYAGCDSSTKTLDPRLRLGQTESYSVYAKDGRVVKGAGKVIPKTKYEEDVFANNHTSVWGSFFSRYLPHTPPRSAIDS